MPAHETSPCMRTPTVVLASQRCAAMPAHKTSPCMRTPTPQMPNSAAKRATRTEDLSFWWEIPVLERVRCWTHSCEAYTSNRVLGLYLWVLSWWWFERVFCGVCTLVKILLQSRTGRRDRARGEKEQKRDRHERIKDMICRLLLKCLDRWSFTCYTYKSFLILYLKHQFWRRIDNRCPTSWSWKRIFLLWFAGIGWRWKSWTRCREGVSKSQFPTKFVCGHRQLSKLRVLDFDVPADFEDAIWFDKGSYDVVLRYYPRTGQDPTQWQAHHGARVQSAKSGLYNVVHGKQCFSVYTFQDDNPLVQAFGLPFSVYTFQNGNPLV